MSEHTVENDPPLSDEARRVLDEAAKALLAEAPESGYPWQVRAAVWLRRRAGFDVDASGRKKRVIPPAEQQDTNGSEEDA